jgi:hypothetical protein
VPALLALGVGVMSGCGSGGREAPTAAPTTTSPAPTVPVTTVPATTVPATTVPATTVPATTTTTSAVPSSPQPSGDVAAADLIADWKAGDRASALHVATAAAVASLFDTPYAGQTVIGRGCQDVQFPPVICSYGPEGGASASASLYQLTVTQAPDGWYVSSVSIE